MRAIVTPPVLPPEALAELKQWLGITTARDDAPLTSLLHAALDMCAAFTGMLPLASSCEETLPGKTCWQALSTRPVLAVTNVQSIDNAGTAVALASDAYAIELDADGTGQLRLLAPIGEARVRVGFAAGLAASRDVLPEGLRQGIVRLAAHQHREREDSGAGPLPPSSVAALWRPWRRMRLT